MLETYWACWTWLQSWGPSGLLSSKQFTSLPLFFIQDRDFLWGVWIFCSRCEEQTHLGHISCALFNFFLIAEIKMALVHITTAKHADTLETKQICPQGSGEWCWRPPVLFWLSLWCPGTQGSSWLGSGSEERSVWEEITPSMVGRELQRVENSGSTCMPLLLPWPKESCLLTQASACMCGWGPETGAVDAQSVFERFMNVFPFWQDSLKAKSVFNVLLANVYFCKNCGI